MMIGYNYIDGKFVESESESTFDKLDPCTEQELATFKNATNKYGYHKDDAIIFKIGEIQKLEDLL